MHHAHGVMPPSLSCVARVALIWGVLSCWSCSSCQAPPEPPLREVKVPLRAGGAAQGRLDAEVARLKRWSSIRPSLPEDLLQGGYSEFMKEMMSSWDNFLDYTPARDDRFEEGERLSRGKVTWRKRLQQLARVVRYGLEKEEIMSLYAGRQLYPAVGASYWLGKAEAESLDLAEAEQELFEKVFSIVGSRLMPSLRRCNRSAPCGCRFVACAAGTGTGAAGAAGAAGARGTLLALELRGRFLWHQLPPVPAAPAMGLAALALEGSKALENVKFWLGAFPKLRVLQLSVSEEMLSNASQLLLGGWQLLGLVLRWDEAYEVPLQLLEAVCSQRKLLRLELDGYVMRLPKCLGSLPLLELDVRGLQFRDAQAVPRELRSLPLISFIAYSQGVDRRCPQEPSWNASEAFLQRCRARPSWDAAEPVDGGEDDWAWQCPWESWVVKLDDPEAPWWHWHNLERFWVDANFFHGSFPEALVAAWPRMRSLDLQLNELSGVLPEGLGKLQNLSALRVHRNNFSGEVPGMIFEAPSLHYTNFEGNAELTGCIPAENEAWHVLDLPIQGTQIIGLCNAEL